MKITHVAEIVNITNVAEILEAEICVAENMRAVLMYNPQSEGSQTEQSSLINTLRTACINHHFYLHPLS